MDLEPALRRAELRAFEESSKQPRKFYGARDLSRVFREAGAPACEIRSFAFRRQAPFDSPTRSFPVAYLEDLRGRTPPHLDGPDRARLDVVADPDSPRFAIDDPDALLVCAGHGVAATPRKRTKDHAIVSSHDPSSYGIDRVPISV
ncbi:hypothetical protein [Paludisphaera mucosa]|uniref:Uncharacterized protein n=1 Tax=Paludisphaera mucosa TaxID=3030827 RepID=A0ABT6F5R1_9BACT|nr:hypothetical protein [Paludisphaera mucosa]MDG3002918.1 hypothetical protein [Paludisphaera mucosa]